LGVDVSLEFLNVEKLDAFEVLLHSDGRCELLALDHFVDGVRHGCEVGDDLGEGDQCWAESLF
jgi:hypothetical protein